MIKTSIIEMNENEHGLVGFGNIILNHKKDKKHEAYYFIPKHNLTIHLNEDEASKIFSEVITSDEFNINFLLRLATESCGIPLFRIKEKSRREEVVFAKNLVMWYCIKYLDFTTLKAAKLMGYKTHNGALHGSEIIQSDPKYLKEHQRLWRKTFMNKLIQHGLMVKHKKD